MAVGRRFDLDAFIVDCSVALAETDPVLAVRDVVARSLAEPAAVAAAMSSEQAELVPLFSSPTLTIMKAVWSPSMLLPPHNHLMWGVIGVYSGRESNQFFRSAQGGLAAAGGREFFTGDVGLLGRDAIHAVKNPLSRQYTGAIHVYGGDFMNEQRSVWLGDPPSEEPATGQTMQRFFVEAEPNDGLA